MKTTPILLFLATLFFFTLCAPSVFAAGLFTVTDVRIDVTADNALKARDQAFEQAQIKAFKMLGHQLKENGEIDTFSMPKPSVISTLVQDYEITDEKLSAVRYIGTYTFRFRENATRRYLMPAVVQMPQTQYGYDMDNAAPRPDTPYQDQYALPAGPLLILPFFEKAGGEVLLWSDQNPWMNAWISSRALNGPVSVRVPIGDLEDVRDLKDNEALTYDPQALHRLMKRYNTNGAVIAIATMKTNTMHVDIYHPRTPRPQFIQRINVGVSEGLETGALNLAVIETFKYLQNTGRSFTDNARATKQPARANTLYVRVPFSTPREWAETQHVLRGVQTIKSVHIKSLSPKSAYVELAYLGAHQALLNALDQANIEVTQAASHENGMTEIRLKRYSGGSYLQRF
jgi:hypothetical protein